MPEVYKKIVIGIDQSYTKTGISIAVDGKLIKVTSTNFRGLKTKTEKRKHLANIIYQILEKNRAKASEVLIICEKIRTFSKGFLSTNYIKATAALIATIVDTAYEFNVAVYSVDTRSWKSKVVGHSKGGKQPTVNFVQNLGFNLYIRTNKKGEKLYDDDAADSGCIALYGFLSKSIQKLKKEE